MATEMRSYDNEHGEPVVVMVTTGNFDVSRLVALLSSGRCEDVALGEKVRRSVRRHNGGREALQLLNQHGCPDFTDPVKDGGPSNG